MECKVASVTRPLRYCTNQLPRSSWFTWGRRLWANCEHHKLAAGLFIPRVRAYSLPAAGDICMLFWRILYYTSTYLLLLHCLLPILNLSWLKYGDAQVIVEGINLLKYCKTKNWLVVLLRKPISLFFMLMLNVIVRNCRLLLSGLHLRKKSKSKYFNVIS